MHVHLPKPLHGWREFAGEVGIIVIGVLIALLGEALFDEWSWERKVDTATNAMNQEIRGSLVNTIEADRMKNCSDTQLNYLQAKLIAKDWSVLKAPVQWAYGARHFYGEDAYTAAVAGQVAEHLKEKQLQQYAGIYTQIRKIRQHQEDGWTTDAVFNLMNTAGLPKSDAVQLEELNALAKLRDSLQAIRAQGESLRSAASKDLGITPSPAELSASSVRDHVAACESAAAVVLRLQAH